jgi:hypothetical protein
MRIGNLAPLAGLLPALAGQSAATGSKTYAGDTYAALTRDMWNSYVQNFMPYENKLIEYAQSPTVVSDAMSEASGLVEQSFAQQQGATQRRLKGLGLTLDADEQKAVDRSYGMAKSLADVTAQNVAGQQTRERQQSVLGHPAPMPG